MYIFILLIGGIFLTIGDVAMKYWTITDKWPLYASGMAVYMLAMVCLSLSFKQKNIAVASLIFEIFNLVTLLAVSYMIFRERLSVTQILGVILAMAAVILMEL